MKTDWERPENIIGWLMVVAGIFLGVRELLQWIVQ